MFRPIWGLVLGAAVGLVFAGATGGVLGAVAGMVLGLGWHAVATNTTPLPHGHAAEKVQRKIMCVGRGAMAECTFLRDSSSGRWLDVESCSLYPGGHPECAKRCLRLMEDLYRRTA